MRHQRLRRAIAVALSVWVTLLGLDRLSAYVANGPRWPTDAVSYFVNPANADVTPQRRAGRRAGGGLGVEPAVARRHPAAVRRADRRHRGAEQRQERSVLQPRKQRQHHRRLLLLVERLEPDRRLGHQVLRRRLHVLTPAPRAAAAACSSRTSARTSSATSSAWATRPWAARRCIRASDTAASRADRWMPTTSPAWSRSTRQARARRRRRRTRSRRRAAPDAAVVVAGAVVDRRGVDGKRLLRRAIDERIDVQPGRVDWRQRQHLHQHGADGGHARTTTVCAPSTARATRRIRTSPAARPPRRRPRRRRRRDRAPPTARPTSPRPPCRGPPRAARPATTCTSGRRRSPPFKGNDQRDVAVGGQARRGRDALLARRREEQRRRHVGRDVEFHDEAEGRPR